MSLHKEINFETEICEQLATGARFYAEKDASDYDRRPALFSADALAWVQGTQPEAWQALCDSPRLTAMGPGMHKPR